MKKLCVVLAALAVSLAAAGAAQAGCWATVGLRPLPDGTKAGEVWAPELEVLQHGRTPYAGGRPSVLIRDRSGKRHVFPAGPAGRPGIYRAEVRFPKAGTWSIAVNDGFTACGGSGQVHTFGAVAVSGGGTGGFPLWPVLGGILGAAAVVGGAMGARRAAARRVGPAARPAQR